MSAVLKISREWAWRMHFSPNPRTPEIGTVRYFAGNERLVGGLGLNLSRSTEMNQPRALASVAGALRDIGSQEQGREGLDSPAG
jgi:hypothetical protein